MSGNRWNSLKRWKKRTHIFFTDADKKTCRDRTGLGSTAFSDDERDKAIAEFITEQLKGIENLDDVFMDLLDAIGKGISVMEIEWGVEAGANVILGIEYVHPKS